MSHVVIPLDYIRDGLRAAFPSCATFVRNRPEDGQIELIVRDSGGFEAHARVSTGYDQRSFAADSVRAIDELSDMFETPSHWMAL